MRTLVISVPSSVFSYVLASPRCQHVSSVGHDECREQAPALAPS